MRGSRGGALATVLAVGALAFTLAFVAAGSSIAYLSFVHRSTDGTRARRAAEAAVLLGLERLQGDPAYGTVGHPRRSELLEVDLGGGTGRLTFEPDRGLGYSTNNLEGDSGARGWDGRVVPRHAAHLVGTGTCKGVTRQVEATVHLPPYPYVLACSGAIHAEGLLVGRVQSAEELAGLDLSRDLDRLLPGDVASNSAGEVAVALGPASVITGNLEAQGGVVLDPGVEIRGEVRSPADPVALPRLDIRSYDPALGEGSYQELPSSLAGETLVGFSRCPGDLAVVGGLRLQQALLYVDGDLRVWGGVEGTGLVAVTGTTTVYDGASLQAGGQAVLLSGRDVTLAGSGRNASAFQGLIYTEGNLSAQDISLVGTYVGAGSDSSVSLDSVNLIHVAEYSRAEFEIAASGPTAPPTPSSRADGMVKGYEDRAGGRTLTVEVYPLTGEERDRLLRPGSDLSILQESFYNLYYDFPPGQPVALGVPYSVASDVLNRFNQAPAALTLISSAGHWQPYDSLPDYSSTPWSSLAPPEQGSSLRFDLDEFLGTGDRLRLLLWSER